MPAKLTAAQARKLGLLPKRNKYGAKATVVDGYRFASRKEAKRFGELRLLQEDGKIDALTLQPRFPLKVNGELVCEYRADFTYLESGRWIVEDVKGGKATKTAVYRLKKKLMAAILGIAIQEV